MIRGRTTVIGTVMSGSEDSLTEPRMKFARGSAMMTPSAAVDWMTRATGAPGDDSATFECEM
jgi:hypothetical protein